MTDTLYDPEWVARLVSDLEGSRRRVRQEASHELAIVAHEDSELMVQHADALIEALYRPEAQTRWEVFDVLSEVAINHADLVGGGFEGAEAALFDETSARLRLAAFRFLARYGMSSPERSDQVWPVMNEAIQCYHGDPEYRDMLLALLDFARGDLSDATREALIARISFDANNGRNYMRAYSAQIVAAAKGE